jgi:hypothetical protein
MTSPARCFWPSLMSWMRSYPGLVACCLVACAAATPAPVLRPVSPKAPARELSPVAAASSTGGCPDGFQPSQQLVQKDWLGAYALVKEASSVWVDADDPTTAEDARDGLCLGTSGIVGMPPNLKTHCTGDYWIISTDHQYYTDHTFVIVPRGSEAIVFDAGQIGVGLCSGEQSSSLSSLDVTLRAEQLSIKASSESYEWSEGGPVAERCQRAHTDVAQYLFDLRTGLACEAFHAE